MTKKDSSGKGPAIRRSVCPVACGLDILGDRWTLLVVRDLLLGRTRFKDFATSPEGIPTNVLSERLVRLVGHGIVTRVEVAAGSKHLAYRLTKKGEALRGVVGALKDWGLRWEEGTRAALDPAGPAPAASRGSRRSAGAGERRP